MHLILGLDQITPENIELFKPTIQYFFNISTGLENFDGTMQTTSLKIIYNI